MKPSETIGIKNINKLSNTKVYILDKKTIINLDNRFIDREELKDKVFNKLYDIDCLIRFETEGLETMDRDNYILDKTINQIKKEILELLK